MAQVQVIDQNQKDLGKKELKIFSDRSGPYRLDYAGNEYWSTGKTGTNTKTGAIMIEMATDSDARAWVSQNENIVTLD